MPQVHVGDSVVLIAGGPDMQVTAVERGSVTCAWSYRDAEAGWLVVARREEVFPESAVRKVVPSQ
ncbi:hypothetical protein [Urbifossiella limnaea]|uniref:DUF2158 domain-containing protein n=1 Tax=Urbifossiella limnaea TaxID=2528023 RepID=A0A517Y1R0_9BACT|nr:hypothetical protein [Urbifossiella limnaea]QDU23703.1 hypothetical protein ETAA1_57090 [Urbifossiella limnaea]